MRYGIVVNPVAGGTDADEKRELLEQITEILGGDCTIAGLDSESAEDFRALAVELLKRTRQGGNELWQKQKVKKGTKAPPR